MRIGIQSLGLELHPAVSDDHRLWQHNYGQIWDRQQRRQADEMGSAALASAYCVSSYVSEHYRLAIDHRKLHVHVQKLLQVDTSIGRGGRREVRAQRYTGETQFANKYGGIGQWQATSLSMSFKLQA